MLGISVMIVGDELWRTFTRPRRLINGMRIIAEDSMFYYNRRGRAFSKLTHPLAPQ